MDKARNQVILFKRDNTGALMPEIAGSTPVVATNNWGTVVVK